MPYTSNKGFSVQTVGSNSGTWGADSTTPTANSSNALNEGVIQLIDQCVGGTTTYSLSSSNVTMTQAQAQNGMQRCTGTLLANVAISASSVLMTGLYAWENVTSGNFTVTLTNAAGSVVLPQSRRGLVWIDTTNAPRIIAIAGSAQGDIIPVGTVMLFYQNAAPTGWTISASLNDYALKIVSSAGGVTSGSVAYSTLFGRTTTDSTTLTTNQIPAHTHGQDDTTVYSQAPSTSSFTVQVGPNTLFVDTARVTESTGGGAGHTHPLDMRVQTASVILASKN